MKFTATGVSTSALQASSYLSGMMFLSWWPAPGRRTPMTKGCSRVTSPRKRRSAFMRIDGEWRLCQDGEVRPVFSGVVEAHDASTVDVRFLADTGADHTVFSADA